MSLVLDMQHMLKDDKLFDLRGGLQLWAQIELC